MSSPSLHGVFAALRVYGKRRRLSMRNSLAFADAVNSVSALSSGGGEPVNVGMAAPSTPVGRRKQSVDDVLSPQKAKRVRFTETPEANNIGSHAVDVEVQTDNGLLEDVISDTATATAESVRAAVMKVHEEAMKIKEKDVEQMKREHEVQVKKINDELERAQQERNEAMKHVTDWNNLKQECDGLRMESASWEKECKRERKHCQEWEMKCVEGRIEIMELEEALMARGTDSEHEQEVMMTGRKKRSGCSSKKQSKAQRKTVLTRKSKRMRMKQLEKSPTTLDFEFVGSSEEDDEQTQAMQRLPWYAWQKLLRNKPKKHLQDEEYFDDLMMAAQDPFSETAVNEWLMTIDPMAAVGPVPDEDAEE